jgi:SAM-dependent methyltransferase
MNGKSREKIETSDDTLKSVFFTICSWNYLAYAITLWESLIRSNGCVSFYAAICDARDGFDYLSLPFPVILLDELGIPSLDSMTRRYSITELNTSIKPFVFKYLFEKYPDAAVIYMDPDILVTSRLAELRQALLEGADCVLTPHILEPNEFAAFDDQQMLLYGICNLGFCALRATPKVERVVSWWGRRLEQLCVMELANGLFVDQKWADLLPAFIERTRMLHHCGYNVAYWNLSQRRVSRTGDGWTVNNQPLRFFHFSGNQIDDSMSFSRHSRDFRLPLGDAQLLFEEYANKVRSNGHHYYRRITPRFPQGEVRGEDFQTPQSAQRAPLIPDGPCAPGSSDADQVLPHIPLMRVPSLSMYLELRALMQDTITDRLEFEANVLSKGTDTALHLSGYCVLCGKPSTFQVNSHSQRALRNGPDWPEYLKCAHCGFENRIRAFLHIFYQEGRPAKEDRIYISEQATPVFSWLACRFPNLVGSEYIGEAIQSGVTVDNIRHEDLENLSFDDRSFNSVLSLDALKHVPDYRKAFREICRCLKDGGLFLFSVPFRVEQYDNLDAARSSEDGKTEPSRTPERHESPADPGHGFLRHRYFGWEILDDLVKAGFERAECCFYWSRQNMYLGEPQLVLMARKP